MFVLEFLKIPVGIADITDTPIELSVLHEMLLAERAGRVDISQKCVDQSLYRKAKLLHRT